ASKGGTVHLAVWDYPNGFDDGSCAHSNYIILKDTTTTPTTYQLYLHLAFDSIPEDLRTIGAPVVQGQYIGNADDTGCSTGHHLHFHVHTNSFSYWGTALDITFDDVSINGGRPAPFRKPPCPTALPPPAWGNPRTPPKIPSPTTSPPPPAAYSTRWFGDIMNVRQPSALNGWASMKAVGWIPLFSWQTITTHGNKSVPSSRIIYSPRTLGTCAPMMCPMARSASPYMSKTGTEIPLAIWVFVRSSNCIRVPRRPQLALPLQTKSPCSRVRIM
ncbi:MAG: M23 family metallopeptidase, partial [Anaerolineae bacterium]|nr:M23 family metallopeptidase [Anaerolineae bacterium]